MTPYRVERGGGVLMHESGVDRPIESAGSADPLTELAIRHGTDKWGTHFYTPHYDRHFRHLRDRDVRLLEIGVGGYGTPDAGGESLRMWKDYFSRGRISGVDIYDKKALEEERIRTFQGSQVDEAFLRKVAEEAGPFDLIIDDGSHLNEHIIQTFEILFPLLRPDGIYAVEDLQTSYWPEYGGDSFNLSNRRTAMNYFKRLTDSLNHQEIDNPFYRPSYLDRTIVA
jgi:hypothetical protein